MQMCAVISIFTKATENKRKNVEKKVDGFKMMTKTYKCVSGRRKLGVRRVRDSVAATTTKVMKQMKQMKQMKPTLKQRLKQRLKQMTAITAIVKKA